MAKFTAEHRSYVAGRWHHWLRSSMDVSGCTSSALARYLQAELDGPDADLRDLRDRAPRGSVRNWLNGGYATSASAFNVGQAIGRNAGWCVDGISALYGAGHIIECIALLDTIIMRAARAYVANKSYRATELAHLRFLQALIVTAGLPIAFANLDGFDILPLDDCAAAQRQIRGKLEPQWIDDAWEARDAVLPEWTPLFAWARTRNHDLEVATLFAWSAFLDDLAIRAWTGALLNERWNYGGMLDAFAAYKKIVIASKPMLINPSTKRSNPP